MVTLGNTSTPEASPPMSPLTPAPDWIESEGLDLFIPITPVLGKREADLENADDPSHKRLRHDESAALSPVELPAPAMPVVAMSSQATSTSSDAKASEATIPSVAEILAMNAQYVPPRRDLGDPDSVDPRVPPQTSPEVYSYYRQALCESLPYYQAYQSSCYSSACEARGLLIDKEFEARDYLGSQIIITTCGGGRTRDGATNSMVRMDNQAPNSALIRSLLKAMKKQTPLGLIIGEDHPMFAWKPPQSYCVLDWFIITDIWTEKVLGTEFAVTVFKLRLKKVDKNKVSWWAPPESDFDAMVWKHFQTSFPACAVHTCEACKNPSKEIYTSGWTCLSFNCPEYFQFGQEDVDNKEIMYSNAFLAERTEFNITTAPLRASIPTTPNGLHGTEKIFRKGIVCPNCGLCSSRIYWNRWTCESVKHGDLKGCGNFQLLTQMNPYPVSTLRDETEKFDCLMKKRRSSYNANGVVLNDLATRLNIVCIQFSRFITLGSYEARQYFLPDQHGKIIGSVTLFPADAQINSRVDGPDELWQELSETDLGLRRNPVALKGKKGQGLTRHFTHNFGAPYKFGVSVQSSGFDEAPDCVMKGLHRLDWAARVSVASTTTMISLLPHAGDDSPPSSRKQYNELLVLGYMTDDQINYHDDGEKQLGPTVATLSLGCPAVMSFRPKASTQLSTNAVPRVAKGKYQDVLELPIKHGDMVVMHGAVIHRLYEHKVRPLGSRRFAMTCRYVDPKTMTDEVDIKATLQKGAIPAESYRWSYPGN